MRKNLRRFVKFLRYFVVTIIAFVVVFVVVMESLVALFNYKYLPKRFIDLPAPREAEMPSSLAFPLKLSGASENMIFTNERLQERWMIERFAPVILQETGRKPYEDIPIAVDFDGNDVPIDNVPAFAKQTQVIPTLYAELSAETQDSYYFTYLIYHISDYDHPLREWLVASWTFHEHDLEGFHLQVDKKTMKPVGIETWYHNRSFYCNETMKATGNAPVHGFLSLYQETRPIIWIEAGGHGVRCAQAGDADRPQHVLLLPGDSKTPPVRLAGDLPGKMLYKIENFDIWQKNAQSQEFYDNWVVVGHRISTGEKVKFGRFLRGRDPEKDPMCKPKPPWAWDEMFDDVPIAYWYLFPAESFARYTPGISRTYIRHQSLEKLTGLPTSVIFKDIQFTSDERNRLEWWKFNERHPFWISEDEKDKASVFKRFVVTNFQRYINVIFVLLE